MGQDRLLNPNGLGIDSAGNYYVSSEDLLRSYTPEGRLRWQLESTMFIDCMTLIPAATATTFTRLVITTGTSKTNRRDGIGGASA